MHDKLFVYGSLMGDIDSNIARFLRRNSRFIGHFRARGRLYDLGYYPGLVASPGNDHWVDGHLYQLLNPPSVLPAIDDYEGIVPGSEDNGPYRRSLAKVYREDLLEWAWIYFYDEPAEDLPLIPFNNYLDYLKINDAHQKFIQSV